MEDYNDRFTGLNITETPYKTVRGHEILAGVMVPQNLAPGKTPIIVRFHGGFLFTGGYKEMFVPWLAKYTLAHSAILVAVDYRLMPEHNGLEIMEDLNDFWEWVFSGGLQKHLGDSAQVDLDRVLVQSDSAGGYLAAQSVLSLGTKVKGMLAVYPLIDLKIPFFTTAFERNMVGFPMLPADTIEKYKATLKGDEVISSAAPPARFDLGFSAIQQGKFCELLGDDSSLYPMERLEKENIKELPALMILHGAADSAVPYRSSEAFTDKVKELLPNTKVYYKAVPGEEHGLDKDGTLEGPDWLVEGLNFITPIWLGTKI